MEDRIISYETAKLAKEKGFDIIPRYGIEASLYKKDGEHTYYANYGFMYSGLNGGYISAPTQALLQKWLREKHNIHIYVETTPRFDKTQGSKWKSDIKYCFQPFKWTTGHYYLTDTYEEALEQGLIEALKLIK
jgi:hypothetical protein